MKEVRSKKTGATHILSDEEYEELKKLGIASRFTVSEITPVRFINPPIIKKEDLKSASKSKNK